MAKTHTTRRAAKAAKTPRTTAFITTAGSGTGSGTGSTNLSSQTASRTRAMRDDLVRRLAKQGGLQHRTDEDIRATFAAFIGEARELGQEG